MVALGLGDEFQMAEEILPAAAGGELGARLAGVLTRLAPPVVVLGIPPPGAHRAEPVLRLIRRQSPPIPVLAVLAADRPEEAGALLELGATDFAVRPLRAGDFLPRWRRLHTRMSAGHPQMTPLAQRIRSSQIIGESSAITAVIQMLPRLARSDASVLITGETGTGKELFARAPRVQPPLQPPVRPAQLRGHSDGPAGK